MVCLILIYVFLFSNPELASADFQLEKAGAQKLISWTEIDSNEVLARLVQAIGDCARAEENRVTLGEAGAMEALGKLLETRTDLNISKFAVRAIGNLCYEQRTISSSTSPYSFF